MGLFNGKIKGFFCLVCEKIGCKEHNGDADLVSCENQLEAITKERDHYINELSELGKDADSKDAKLVLLMEELSNLKKSKIDTDYVEYVNRPKADITYKSWLPLLNKEFKRDVREFVDRKNFWIYNELKKQKLLITNSEECDKIIPLLDKWSRKNIFWEYSYAFDQENYGKKEVWLTGGEMASALREKIINKEDCDGYMALKSTIFDIAGVPAGRNIFVAGMTRGGIGHATNHYLCDDLETWVHINSTNPVNGLSNFISAREYPLISDESDKIGIKDDGYWFSSSPVFSYNDFETSANEENFNKHWLRERLTIKPIME